MFQPPRGTPDSWGIWGKSSQVLIARPTCICNPIHLLAHSHISNPDHLLAPSTFLRFLVFRKIRQITDRVVTAKAWGQYPPVVTLVRLAPRGSPLEAVGFSGSTSWQPHARGFLPVHKLGGLGAGLPNPSGCLRESLMGLSQHAGSGCIAALT